MTFSPVPPIMGAAALAITSAAVPPPAATPIVPTPVVAKPALRSITSPRHQPKRGHAPSAASIVGVSSANRAATLEPAAQAFVDAVQVYPYAEGLLFKVYAAPGRITDITLQPGETLVSVASGDTVRWVIGDTSSGTGDAKRTHVLIKPFTAGLATNLVIATDRRSYHLALASTAGAAMAALSWTYPQDALISIKRAASEATVAAPVASGLAVDRLQFGYTITGDKPVWRPIRAFDDGRQTFIEFPPSLAVAEAPPLFLVDHNGEAQLVNYRLSGRYYVVDRLFDAAELRLGTKHPDVVRISRLATDADRKPS